MKSNIIYFILIVSVLVSCTKESDSEFNQVVNQNEANINQLKEVAANSGWKVSPKVEEGDRTTPLTEAEIKEFKDDLHKYSVYPRIKEEREVEIVPIGNKYLFLLPFTSRLSTKAASSGSVIVYITYGYCFYNRCNQCPINVRYDLNEHGNISYAFAGTECHIPNCDLCSYGITSYTTANYECAWGSDTVSVKLWLNRTMHSSFYSTDREHFMVTGTINIKTGEANLESEYFGKDSWDLL